jgi:hypothetical protein
MRKSLAVIAALCLVIAFSLSITFPSVVKAMPAPLPDNVESSIGLTQWGAETEAPLPMSSEEMHETLLQLARPIPPAKSKAAMCETLASAAQEHDLPVGFFVRLINQESGFNPEIVSHAGAQGVAQFMPKVAEEWGLKNPFDPHAALVASARFLRSLYNQLGNWGLAAAAYNGGIGRVQKWRTNRGKLPDETRNYVKTITGMPAEKWADGKPQPAKFSIPPRAPCQDFAHLADPASQAVPLPPTRAPQYLEAAAPSGPSPRAIVVSPVNTTKVAVVSVKRGTKVAVIRVKGASKVAAVQAKPATNIAAVSSKIAAPAPIVASAAASAAPPKGKHGKAPAAVKVAEKAAPKSQAKAKVIKKSKGVQVAEAQTAGK